MTYFVVGMAIFQVVAFVVLTRYVLAEIAQPKNDNGAAGREARLLKLYGHMEELMDVFETYIDEVRQDVEKERTSLTEMSRQAATLYMLCQKAGNNSQCATGDGRNDVVHPVESGNKIAESGKRKAESCPTYSHIKENLEGYSLCAWQFVPVNDIKRFFKLQKQKD